MPSVGPYEEGVRRTMQQAQDERGGSGQEWMSSSECDPASSLDAPTTPSPPTERDLTVTAIHRTLDIIELFESILGMLTMPELLVTRGVSKEWKDIIETLLPLRKKLFLEPGSHSRLALDRQVMSLEAATRPCRCPFLTPSFQSTLNGEALKFILPCRGGERSRGVGVTFHTNSLSKRYTYDLEVATEYVRYWFTWSPGHFDTVTRSSIARSAFLTQPPCTTVELWARGAAGVDIGRYISPLSASVHSTDGVTLGLLVNTFEEMVKDAVSWQGSEQGWNAVYELVLCFEVRGGKDQ